MTATTEKVQINPRLDQLIVAQLDYHDQISKIWTNFKKLALTKRTRSAVQNRLDTLETFWKGLINRHDEILVLSTLQQRQSLDYFTQEAFSCIIATVQEVRDSLAEALESVEQTPAASGSNSNSQVPGELTAWPAFQDLFKSLVDARGDLTCAQKLHYLKASLAGEASELLTSTEVTDSNFKTAWELLQKRYENPRAIVYAYLDRFAALPAVSSNRARDLRYLRDQAHQIYHAILALKRPINLWEDQFVHSVLSKLDEQTRHEWELTQQAVSTFPTFDALDEYLSLRLRAFQTAEQSKLPTSNDASHNFSKREVRKGSVRSHQSSATKVKCFVCQGEHPLFQCSTFMGKSVQNRISWITQQERCVNCFRRGHRAKECNNGNLCRICKNKHHTLLHIEQAKPCAANTGTRKTPAVVRPTDTTSSNTPASDKEIVNNCVDIHTHGTVLPTATVLLRTSVGRTLKVRALLDQGSQATFISESAVQLLKPERKNVAINVSGIGSKKLGAVKQAAVVTLQSVDCGQSVSDVTALILPKLSAYLPPTISFPRNFPPLDSLRLADSDPLNREPIELIIGADYFGAVLRDGLIRGPSGAHICVNHTSAEDETLAALSKFWELEELPKLAFPTEDEARCEEHFQRTHSRHSDGRYIVRLPFKSSLPIPIGDAKIGATRLFQRQEARILREPELSRDYNKFLREYLCLKHMERVPFEEENSANVSYLPHHPVIKESSSTTKLRVVFNASFKSDNQTSLNDHLLIGPKLQADLSALILRWRAHRFVYTTDLEKMFRQIIVHKDDVDFQRILWRAAPEDVIQSYRLLTVTYGTSCAPYLANRVLRQLAVDEGPNFPLAANVLSQNVYVDDVMFGADDCESLKLVQKQLTRLLRAGGFRAHKWSANDLLLLSEIPNADLAGSSEKKLSQDSQLTVLGIHWEPDSDVFRFNVSESPPVTSKRTFLSLLARIFDPHGWAAPVIIYAKILLQSFWKLRLNWDESLPLDLAEKCLTFQQGLPLLNQLMIPRWTGLCSDSTVIQIHGFCDASNVAYAATVYLRLQTPSTEASTVLLFSKTKVAPVKVQSIPRLELCAAHLLTRAVKFVTSQVRCSPTSIYCWTDSTVVLAWLRSHASRWKPFVANRVSNIQSELPTANWRHVPTSENPSDCASRGIPAHQLPEHPLWVHGPHWLCRGQSDWPDGPQSAESPDMCDEQRATQAHQASVDILFTLADKVSSWTRLLRITAYIFRFVYNLRHKTDRITYRWVNADEIRKSSEFWVRYYQNLHFPESRVPNTDVTNGKPSQTLRNLNVYKDAGGILRVGGRLRNSSLPWTEKFPILLPTRRISRLIAQHAHLVTLHGGLQVTLRYVRQNYWVIHARSLVKQIIHQCVVCTRHRAALLQQKMGDLPAARVTPSRPFTHTGVDYAGPFFIRASKGRGIKTHKAYCIIFVCLSVRAIHLECADDATTAGFLAAFDRFTSRRGLPASVYSDNATNFVGASRELSANYNQIINEPELVNKYVADGIDWRFNPPATPHFGGLWEAGVKSVKFHLRRIIGEFTPTFEEFSTLLCKIECVLNSRPISPLYDDPESLDVLTPGHFLAGSYLRAVPVPSVLHIDENRLDRWQTIQRLHETFWKTWSADYLNSIQQRLKWQRALVNVQVGDLVLVKNANLPPAKWEMGRITRCFPGQDALVRVVLVRTARSEYKRPITQLCRLPVDSHTVKGPPPS